MTRLRRVARPQEHARPVQKKLLHRGRPPTRGTEVVAEGGEEVGGLHRSVDVGELVGNSDPVEQRRPVCECDLQEGTMSDTLMSGGMSPELLEVVERAQ